MGMTPSQCRLIVLTQGFVLTLAGLQIGLPAGLVVGRLLWRTVAGYTPVQYVPPIATVVMVVIVPAALVLASLLGAWPGHRAARLRGGLRRGLFPAAPARPLVRAAVRGRRA